MSVPPVSLVPSTDASDPPDDRFGEGVRHLAARLKFGMDVLLHAERDVGTTDPFESAF